MKKITLGRTNEQVSIISLGAWSFGKGNTSGGSDVGWSNQSDKDSKSALLKAFSYDINHWDTADVYGEGHSEKIIGSMWNEISRDNIFLASKVGWDMGPHNHWYHPKYMKIKMEKSIKNLKTDYVDLMYLHHCNFGKNNEYFDDAAEILYRFKEEGKTRFIGLSDWSSKRILKYIEKIDPDVVQPLYNVHDTEYVDSGLKQHVKSNNIGTCYFSPIKHGILTGKYESIVEFPEGDFRRNVKEFKSIDFINKMKENKKKIEERFSNTTSDPILHALLGAILYDNPTACVLLGQRNERQASAAGKLGQILNEKDADWVLSLYKN
tara:strand:+ start:42 stop:1007 length:966 start_codon:yes stop_codon:yes gene_type:complete